MSKPNKPAVSWEPHEICDLEECANAGMSLEEILMYTGKTLADTKAMLWYLGRQNVCPKMPEYDVASQSARVQTIADFQKTIPDYAVYLTTNRRVLWAPSGNIEIGDQPYNPPAADEETYAKELIQDDNALARAALQKLAGQVVIEKEQKSCCEAESTSGHTEAPEPTPQLAAEQTSLVYNVVDYRKVLWAFLGFLAVNSICAWGVAWKLLKDQMLP
jgi:hypothetical protein